MSAPDPVIAWADRFGTAVAVANGCGRWRDVAALKTILADKPDGLPTEWWTLVDHVAAWIERMDAMALPPLGVTAALDAALAAPPQRRFAWQDRSDA